MKSIFISLFFVCIAGLVSADTVDDIVTMSQERGIVSSYRVSDYGATISVRPAFHQMDFTHKKSTAAAFLLHANRRMPNANLEILLIKDSRNNNTVGNYDERLGLTLKKAYR